MYKSPLLRTPLTVLFLPSFIYIVLDTLLPDLHPNDLEGCDVHTHLVLLSLQCGPQIRPDTIQHSFHCPTGHNLVVVCLQHEEEDAAGKRDVHGAHGKDVEEGEKHGDGGEGED